AFQRRHIEGRRQVINDGIEKRLNALVLERGARQHRNDFHRQGGLADGLAHFLDGKISFGQILVQHLIVVLGDVLDDLGAVVVVKLLVNGGTLQGGGNIRTAGNEGGIP